MHSFRRVLLVAPALVALVACGSHEPRRSPAHHGAVAPDEARALFAHLPPPRVTDEGPARLVLRAGPAVPEPNHTELPFPPPPGAAPPPASTPPEPLRVLGYAPRGSDTLVGAVRVTFSQPMVPLEALSALRAEHPPLEISPETPGRYRWLGVDTVVFEPANGGRMPMATAFTARVPAGTRSARGGVLADAVSFAFRTPALELVASHPGDGEHGVELRPTIALEFNQRVDPAALAAALHASAPLELLTQPADRARVRASHPDVAAWPDDRWIALRPRADLPRARRFELVLPRGSHGAEGPEPTPHDARTTFTTHAPLAVSHTGCWTASHACAPDEPPNVAFNNALDDAADLGALFTIAPPVPRFVARRYTPQVVALDGDYAPATRYTLTVHAGVRDAFGQTLGRDEVHALVIGDARSEATVHVDPIATVERAGPHAVPVDTVNHDAVRVQAAAVPPARLAEVALLTRRGGYTTDGLGPFHQLGLTPRSATAGGRGPRNRRERVEVDLSPEVPAASSGCALLDVAISEGRGYVQHNVRLVQVTDLGLTAVVDAHQAVVRVTSLATGAPVAGATVRLAPSSGDPFTAGSAVTDASGVARVTPASGTLTQTVVATAELGDDRALIVATLDAQRERLEGFALTDRDPYRPGDTVHARIVARTRRGDARGSLASLPEGTQLDCVVSDAQGQAAERFVATLDAYGAASHDIATHRGVPLGYWQLRCGRFGASGSIDRNFSVEEYRAPEIAVHATAPAGTRFVHDATRLGVASEYLFGAPAAGLHVAWNIQRSPASFAPPGHDGYTFGDATGAPFERETPAHDSVASGENTLGPDGRLEVPVVLDPGRVAGAARFALEATVTDTSRQAVSARVELVAHPADTYAGLRLEPSFVHEGEPIVAHAIATGVDGAARAGVAMEVRALERRVTLESREVNGRWTFAYRHEDREVGRCALTSGDAPVDCHVAPQRAGEYVLEATVHDSSGRAQTTRTTAWVYGGTYAPSENTGVVELVPDRASYAAGSTAHVLVRAPFAGGRGLVSIERAGIVSAWPVDLVGNVQRIDVPVTAEDLPALTVRVALQRGRASDAELAALLGSDATPEARARAAQDDVGRPQWATSTVQLAVDDAARRFTVDVRPDHAELGPGARLGVDLAVRDADGHPADAELTVMLVDEGVLSLMHYETLDPVALLHTGVGDASQADSVFAHVVRRPSERRAASVSPSSGVFYAMGGNRIGDGFGYGGLGARGTGFGGGGTGEGTIGLGNIGTLGHGSLMHADIAIWRDHEDTAEAPASSRALFATTAFWSAAVRTDHAGHAHVEATLPDNLTTFRIMAVAMGRDDRGGRGEATVRVRKPVVLRPALPRFATWGDRFRAGVVVHNETGAAGEVLVGIRAAGLELEDAGVQRVALAPGESRLVSFPVAVASARGRARVQFAASMAHGSDAAELDVPLVEPATAEAFATYGSVDSGVVRVPVAVPTGALPQFGGLELSLSSTALTGLDDAARWLEDYPYRDAETHASRLIAAAALAQILADGRAPDGAARARALATASFGELRALQRDDGGFAYFPEDRVTELYVSSWVALALLDARRAGVIEPPASVLERALEFIAGRLASPRVDLGEERAWAAQAFGLYVLAQADRAPDEGALARVYAHAAELPLFARVWLAGGLRRAHRDDPRAAALWSQVTNAAVLTNAGAHFAEERVESARLLWHTERRTDAIVLSGLLDSAPNDPLVERTARALIASRRGAGHWETTNETAWALDALVRYLRAAESVPPELTVNAWLGTRFVGETQFHGRTGAVVDGRVPMTELLAAGARAGDLVIAPRGQGRLYYRLGLQYAPRNFALPPASQGFTVARAYEPVGPDPSVVRRDAQGHWRIRAGADVRVRVTLVVPDDRYDVAVDDPLPAGLEATNMAFATSATQRLDVAQDEPVADPGNYWGAFAFDHRELRDDRVVAFARHAPAGVYELTYLARATTVGTFVASATHAEEMYSPETFGRAATDVVIVDP